MFCLNKEKIKPKASYSKLNLFIRSLIFSIYFVPSLIIYSSLIIVSVILPTRLRHLLTRFCVSTYPKVLQKICHVNYKVEGLENIPPHRNGVILCKHQSTWETFFLPTIFHDPVVIVKQELCYVPFFGWALAVSDPIAIQRDQKSSAMQQILVKGKKRLNEGRWVLVFPEGTRVSPDEVGNYKLGGARLAASTGYPVIPVAHNAGRFWPRRKFIKRPGTIHVVIGPLIESEGRTPEEILKLAKDWIEETMIRIDSFVDKSSR